MGNQKRNLLLCIAPGAQPPPGWEAAGACANLLVARGREEAQARLPEADALLLWDFSSRILDGTGIPARLRWIHTASLGVDAVLTPGVVDSHVVVSNTRGVYERPIAEYVLGLMLAIAKDFRATFQHQAKAEWRWRLTRTINGHEVALVGPGAIGTKIKRMLSAVGCNVRAFGRRELRDDPVFGHVQPMAALGGCLPTVDTLIVALPLTSQTRGIIDARLLDCMQPGSTLINIGRGALVDEQALIESLRHGRPGTAALDVFMQEPLPAEHPFWSMPQVYVSPHMSSDIVGWDRLAMDQFLANLARWYEGAELHCIVDKRKFGYAA